MKKVVLILSIIILSAKADCQSELNKMLDKVIFAKEFKAKSNHYVAYKQAEDAMRACRYRVSDKDMLGIITVRDQQKKLAGQ